VRIGTTSAIGEEATGWRQFGGDDDDSNDRDGNDRARSHNAKTPKKTLSPKQ
jgi:hypothetical protein